MNSSNMSDDCIFDGKADIDCLGSSHESEAFNTPKNSAADVSRFKPIKRSVENDTRTDKKIPFIHTRPVVVSPETYRILLDNLYISKLWFVRARSITLNQLTVYKEEAIGHMHEIKRIVEKDLENPEASVGYAAEELVKAGIAVLKNQQALTRIEIRELNKSFDNLVNTLSSDVTKVKSFKEPEHEESQQKSNTDFTLEYGHWCLFVAFVFIIIAMGLFRFLTVL